MQKCVRRFSAVWFLILFFIAGIFAQSLPTSGDVMRDRVKKAKALIAVKNYNAAIYELESIRKDTAEPTVNSVVQVMLMNCYLEQSDYKRAQSLLNEIFNAQKSGKPNANYYAVAGQIVRGAKVQLDRYKALGLMVSDPNLPPDAVNDINKMRETVEIVVTQSKTLGESKKETSNAMALLEEASNARSGLARDDYDAKRWKEEVADARDNMVNSRTVVDAAGTTALPNTTVAATDTQTTSANSSVVIPIADKTTTEAKPENNPAPLNTETAKTNAPNIIKAPVETPKQTENSNSPNTAENAKQTVQNQNTTAAKDDSKPSRMRKVDNGASNQTEAVTPKTETKSETGVKNDAPLTVGSLVEYATAKVSPTYPPVAKTTRTTGTVRVELLVDEQGKVEVQNTSGPGMLKQAALDAVKRWKFKPFLRDGQPVKAMGYVSFNFNL